VPHRNGGLWECAILGEGNKNDSRDAEAICEAVSRHHMRFVPLKTVESQDIQALHRRRSRLIKERPALVNQVRGLVAERGSSSPKGLRSSESNCP
jgi:transposase